MPLLLPYIKSTKAAKINHHRFGGLNNKHLFFQLWKLEVQDQGASRVSGEASLLGMKMIICLLAVSSHGLSSVYMQRERRERERERDKKRDKDLCCVSCSYNNTSSYWIMVPSLKAHLTIIASWKALFPNTDTLVRAFTNEFRGGTQISL